MVARLAPGADENGGPPSPYALVAVAARSTTFSNLHGLFDLTVAGATILTGFATAEPELAVMTDGEAVDTEYDLSAVQLRLLDILMVHKHPAPFS